MYPVKYKDDQGIEQIKSFPHTAEGKRSAQNWIDYHRKLGHYTHIMKMWEDEKRGRKPLSFVDKLVRFFEDYED